jgi:hypothetical protein
MDILGVKKVNKKNTEYFSGVTGGELTFTSNPMESFTSTDTKSVEMIREILQAGDKRNTFQSFKVNIS